MNIDDYPPQEPFTAIGERYHAEVMGRGAGLVGIEAFYGTDPYQGVMVYPATRPNGDVLVLLHGGGWTNGYKEWMAFITPGLSAAGITAVTIGYRLAPLHLHPVAFQDVQLAIAWVFQNISIFGGNPHRLFVHGHSAGGHLAALLSVRHDWQSPLELPRMVIRGCLPISGVYAFGEGAGLPMRPRFLGPVESRFDTDASPLLHVTLEASPFFIAYGDRDFPHLIKQADAMETALRAAGVPVERMVLAESDHLGASYQSADPDGPWLQRALSWMRTI
jgi:acetyl esterase/lipase